MATKKRTAKKPAAAIAKPDAGESMQRMHPYSRANRLAALEVGECASESKRIDLDDTSKADIDEVNDSLTSTMSKAATAASVRSGNKYKTEVGRFFTRSGDLIVTAVVTRTE